MLRCFHELVVSRLLAVVAALVLTGAPRLVAASAPRPTHYCKCLRSAAHDCAHCHPGAIKSGEDANDGPPCHRATGKAKEQQPATDTAPRFCHCCGDPETRLAWTAAPDEFVLPGAFVPTVNPSSSSVGAHQDVRRTSGQNPDTPPPKAA